nr:hypothetical protein [Streptomyces sp. TLI_235]
MRAPWLLMVRRAVLLRPRVPAAAPAVRQAGPLPRPGDSARQPIARVRRMRRPATLGGPAAARPGPVVSGVSEVAYLRVAGGGAVAGVDLDFHPAVVATPAWRGPIAPGPDSAADRRTPGGGASGAQRGGGGMTVRREPVRAVRPSSAAPGGPLVRAVRPSATGPAGPLARAVRPSVGGSGHPVGGELARPDASSTSGNPAAGQLTVGRAAPVLAGGPVAVRRAPATGDRSAARTGGARVPSADPPPPATTARGARRGPELAAGAVGRARERGGNLIGRTAGPGRAAAPGADGPSGPGPAAVGGPAGGRPGPVGGVEDRWRAAVARVPLETPRAFPGSLRPLVRVLTGGTAATYTTGPATRLALAAAGAHGATTRTTVHLPSAPERTDVGLLAHELSHARSPLLRPRFSLHAPGAADADERAARAAGAAVRRAAADGVGELPVGGAAAGLGALVDAAAQAARDAVREEVERALASRAEAAPTAAAGAAPDTAGPAVAPPGAATPAEAAVPGHRTPGIEEIVREIEERVLHQLERRGGRYAGTF